ncbi:YwbE family protein [Candidatus Uhrbacteria bacterium]|nr:YwbE family protein [Candidatus Uhrbacteria bacterium]
MDGTIRKDIHPGLRVAIVKKEDQRSGEATYGVVRDILTSAAVHHRGIKVRLETGEVGRVRYIEV